MENAENTTTQEAVTQEAPQAPQAQAVTQEAPQAPQAQALEQKAGEEGNNYPQIEEFVRQHNEMLQEYQRMQEAQFIQNLETDIKTRIPDFSLAKAREMLEGVSDSKMQEFYNTPQGIELLWMQKMGSPNVANRGFRKAPTPNLREDMLKTLQDRDLSIEEQMEALRGL